MTTKDAKRREMREIPPALCKWGNSVYSLCLSAFPDRDEVYYSFLHRQMNPDAIGDGIIHRGSFGTWLKLRLTVP